MCDARGAHVTYVSLEQKGHRSVNKRREEKGGIQYVDRQPEPGCPVGSTGPGTQTQLQAEAASGRSGALCVRTKHRRLLLACSQRLQRELLLIDDDEEVSVLASCCFKIRTW